MSFQSKHRFARISPRKVRPLANMVRGKFVDEALDILKYQPQRGARMLEKVIKTALANAQDPDQNPCLLYTSPSPRDATLSRMPSSA